MRGFSGQIRKFLFAILTGLMIGLGSGCASMPDVEHELKNADVMKKEVDATAKTLQATVDFEQTVYQPARLITLGVCSSNRSSVPPFCTQLLRTMQDVDEAFGKANDALLFYKQNGSHFDEALQAGHEMVDTVNRFKDMVEALKQDEAL